MLVRKVQLSFILIVALALILVTVTSAGTVAKAQAFQSCMVNSQPAVLPATGQQSSAPWVGKVAVNWLFGARVAFESTLGMDDSSGYTGSISPVVRQTAALIASCLRSTNP